MGQFRKHQNIKALDRTIIVSLIERILIFREHRVEIVYRWHNEFHWQTDLLLQARIKVVVDGDKTNVQEGKNPLQIVAGFPVVAAKPGQILYHDAVYLRRRICFCKPRLCFPERRRSEMARTKRKVNPILPVTVSVEKPKRVYQAGGYVRLSSKLSLTAIKRTSKRGKIRSR
mgnify:CR=1 FL=1